MYHEQNEMLKKKYNTHIIKNTTRKPYKEKAKETKCRYFGKLRVFKKDVCPKCKKINISSNA